MKINKPVGVKSCGLVFIVGLSSQDSCDNSFLESVNTRVVEGYVWDVYLDTQDDVQYNDFVVLDGEVAVPCTRNPL